MRMSVLVEALVVLPVLAGCGEDWGNIPPPDRTTEDALDTADVPTDGADVPDGCNATYSLGVFEPEAERAMYDSPGAVWTVQGSLNSDFEFPVSLVSIESYFSEGGLIAPGTFEFTERVSSETCGTCLFILVDCPGFVATCSTWYAAHRGTLTIDTLERRVGGRVSGSLTDVRFMEFDFNSDESIVGGSSYCVERWDFDLTMDWTSP